MEWLDITHTDQSIRLIVSELRPTVKVTEGQKVEIIFCE